MVAADADRHGSVGADVVAEMAAPYYRITDPNRHRSLELQQSADGSRAHRRRGMQAEEHATGGASMVDHSGKMGMRRKAATRRSRNFGHGCGG